jgi:hypothetical protein
VLFIEILALEEPNRLPFWMVTVLAPDIVPLVIVTPEKIAALLLVIVKLPATVPPVIDIPDCALAPPDKLVPFVVIILPILVTRPPTLPPVKLIFPLAVTAPPIVVLDVVIPLLELVTEPVTFPPVRLIVAGVLIEPLTVVFTSVTFALLSSEP